MPRPAPTLIGARRRREPTIGSAWNHPTVLIQREYWHAICSVDWSNRGECFERLCEETILLDVFDSPGNSADRLC
jgi:hypothetical protein